MKQIGKRNLGCQVREKGDLPYGGMKIEGRLFLFLFLTNVGLPTQARLLLGYHNKLELELHKG